MKKCIGILVLLSCLVPACAQPPSTTDTVWGNWPNQRLYNAVLRATVITGGTPAVNIVPTRGVICFDKKITIKLSTGPRLVEQCLYLDTKNGIVGYLVPVLSANNAMCDLNSDDPDFNFFVISLKGNVFSYKNEADNNGNIKHRVTTSNTETHQYVIPQTAGIAMLHNKLERRSYCNNKFTAIAYKYSNATSRTYYLFGKDYPTDIGVTSNKYLGNFGIGYLYTDKGLYLIMETTGPGFTSKITSIEETEKCFDPSRFSQIENQFNNIQSEELRKEEEKISRDEARISTSSPCSSHELNLIVFRRAEVRRRQENMRIMGTGNNYQNVNVQRASLGLMDPLFMVQGDILNTQLSICKTEDAISRGSGNPGFAERLACLNTFLGKLHVAEEQMSALDARYATVPAKAYSEKNLIYKRLMEASCQ